jgi:hypothetical protein
MSPAAQTVLNAIDACDGESFVTVGVAVLRAAADEVVPEPPMLVDGGRTYEEAWTATVQEDIRTKLLAIAAELGGSNV